MSPFRADEERLCSRGNTNTKGHYGTRPQGSYLNTPRISPECGSGQNASNAESQYSQRNGRKINKSRRPNQICDDGIQGLQTPKSTDNTATAKLQVSEISLQTDSCDTLYVNKDTLVAYTITVVQNTQSLQYEQMQIALQTAQNQASIETPQRAEQLMTAHFNLAVLTNNTGYKKDVNALKSETASVDPGPSTSTSDQETPRKTPYRSSTATKNTRRSQPTGAVLPTCRRDYDLVNGILVGYESDNSWDCNSTIGELEHTCAHDIIPRVAYRGWTNHPNRG